MSYTREEIINALRLIKDICEDRDVNCTKCPFGIKGLGCFFEHNADSPEYWDLTEETEAWRAFK